MKEKKNRAVEKQNEGSIQQMTKDWCNNLAELAHDSNSSHEEVDQIYEDTNDKFEELTKDLADRNLISLWRRRVKVIKGAKDDICTKKEEVDKLIFGILPEDFNTHRSAQADLAKQLVRTLTNPRLGKELSDEINESESIHFKE